MATLQELEQKFMRADQAGDAAAAKVLAAEIRRVRLGAAEKPGVVEDVAKAVPSGVKSGTEQAIGTAGDVGAAQGSVMSRVAKALGFGEQGQQIAGSIGTYANPLSMAPALLKGTEALGITKPVGPTPTSEQIKAKGEKIFPAGKNLNYEPVTSPGKFAKTGTEFATNALLGGGKPKSTLGWGFLTGLGSEAAGQATEGSDLEPWARAGGGLAVGAFPASSDLLLRKGPIKPRAAEFEKSSGVDLTAGQATQNRGLQVLESELGGSRHDQAISTQRDQFTAKAMEKAGAPPGTTATPENVDALYDSLGARYDQMAAKTNIPFDQQMLDDLVAPLEQYQNLVGPTQQAAAVSNKINDAFDLAMKNGGVMNGEQFQALTSDIKKLMRASSADPQTREALGGVVEALNNGIGRNLPPELQDQWAELNNQYRNFKTVQKAIAQGPAHLAQPGEITAPGLRTAARSSGAAGTADVAQGRTELSELANRGSEFMTTPPNSGTAARSSARAVPAAIGAFLTGGPGAAVGALAGAGVGGMLSPVVMGKTMQQIMRMAPDERRYLLSLVMSGRQGAEEGHR